MTDPSPIGNVARTPDSETSWRAQLQADASQHEVALAYGTWLLGQGRTAEAVALLREHIGHRGCGDLLREYLVGERRNEEWLRLLEHRGSEASASALVDLAVASHIHGDFESAIRYCDLALTSDHRYAPAHNHRGRALFNAGRAAQARACLIKAVRIAPGYAEAWHNLAHVLRDGRELEPAEHAYGHALRFRPGYFSASLNRGIVRTALGNQAQALEDFLTALAIDPAHAEACLHVALCQHLLGQHAAARESYDQAIALDPRNVRARLQAGRLCIDMSDIEAALGYFREALDIEPRNAEAWNEIAIAYERLTKYDEAERAVMAGLAATPQDPGLRLEQANLARLRGDPATLATLLRGIDPATLLPHLRARHRQLQDYAIPTES